MRFELIAHGQRAHSGTGGTGSADLADRLIEARASLASLLGSHLKLHSSDGWLSGPLPIHPGWRAGCV
jgi:hypothetical protein